ncbi:MAG: hypothetical protein DWQ05_20965 [Calditrichaeota bacterium]|nr:MAG: hypothetical protein DWQ05_20965 [Calditrichota bacterium]
MGIGFVFLFWGFIFSTLGLISGIFFTILINFLLRKTISIEKKQLVKKSFFIPILTVLYFGIAVILYSIWCEVIRKVDPGFGDYWQVQIQNGYSLGMIDLPSNAFINIPGKYETIHSINRFATYENYILCETKQHGWGRENSNPVTQYIIIDTNSNDNVKYLSLEQFDTFIKINNFNELDFKSPEEFYYKNRWTGHDLIALFLMVLPPLFLLFIFIRKVHRVSKL